MPHHRLALHSSPYAQPADVEVHGFVPTRDPEDALVWAGRCALTFRSGPFDLSLRPTVAELRRLALLCTALADELENTPAAPTSAAQHAQHQGPQHPATAELLRAVRHGATAAALVAVIAFVVLLLAGCGGNGCDTDELGPDGQCLERRTTQPVDCAREPEKCR